MINSFLYYRRIKTSCVTFFEVFITIANADIGSLKSLNTLFDKYLDYMLVKFEQSRMV